MRAAVKLRPKKAVYRFRLARALAASGDASQAAEEAQAALKAGLKEPEASEARTLVAPTGSTP
jgi:cytochrome c-type biogenesis protein CcmH/NrfG